MKFIVSTAGQKANQIYKQYDSNDEWNSIVTTVLKLKNYGWSDREVHFALGTHQQKERGK